MPLQDEPGGEGGEDGGDESQAVQQGQQDSAPGYQARIRRRCDEETEVNLQRQF